MKTISVCVVCVAVAFLFLVTSPVRGGEGGYDFRDTEAYRDLDPGDRDRLEQVHQDLMTLWGALDRYADEHGSLPPEKLGDLVPHYLLRLPLDPFALEERGHYGYRKGAKGNRAWVLASAGLPKFPYLAARGNVGLYVCKGVWLSGVNPILGGAFDPKAARIRKQKVQSMGNLRNLAELLVERSIRKPWPKYGGKNFVLWLVAVNYFDRRNPESMRVLFSPGDKALSAEDVTPERWAMVTTEALKAGADFHELTSYVGRRNADMTYRLTADMLKRVVPILADVSFPGVVLIAFSDASVRELTYAELGIDEDEDVPLLVGDAGPSELLRCLSDE